MRVTNSMISNSARSHISNAKTMLNKYEQQYTTEKKIQRPSDDPTVAVRSLKLRTTYAQLTQYAEKNIQDAMDWMDTTESAMSNISSLLTNMKSYLNQGANDPLKPDDRKSVLSTLRQYVNSIFADEANTDYSGRYVFTGYRTDTSLLFQEDTNTLSYQIKEKLKYTDISNVTVVKGGANYDPAANGQDYVDDAATTDSVYRMNLAYNNLSNEEFPEESDKSIGSPIKIQISYTEKEALTPGEKPETITETLEPVEIKHSTDLEAYNIEEDGIVYLYDTGEILMGKSVYADIQQKQADITVDYCKNSFEKNEIRPEMYFECLRYDSVENKVLEYIEPSKQNINYEVNYSQTITVNTQARDAISTDIYRTVDYIEQTIEAVTDVENRISEVEKMISNTQDKDEIAALNSLKKVLTDEKELRMSVMTEAFGKGLTMVDNAQQMVSVAVSELGAKYNRAQLTYDKLLDEQTDTEEKLSGNEDVNFEDVFINLTQANNLYQASLSATSKILGNTLLNYI